MLAVEGLNAGAAVAICDLTFQLEFGMMAPGMGGEIERMWLRGLKKLYFQNL